MSEKSDAVLSIFVIYEERGRIHCDTYVDEYGKTHEGVDRADLEDSMATHYFIDEESANSECDRRKAQLFKDHSHAKELNDEWVAIPQRGAIRYAYSEVRPGVSPLEMLASVGE